MVAEVSGHLASSSEDDVADSVDVNKGSNPLNPSSVSSASKEISQA
jgi:hypothetical protein